MPIPPFSLPLAGTCYRAGATCRRPRMAVRWHPRLRLRCASSSNRPSLPCPRRQGERLTAPGLARGALSAYLGLMSWFPRPVGPRAAFADLRSFIRHREREHWIGAALALLVTIIIIIEFFVDSKINTAPPPR